MSVQAEQLEDWIGAEVVDPDGTKLGKVAEVFYQGATPLIVEIRSGITGRKHSLAPLAGATVSMKHLRLNVGESESIPTDGGVSPEAVAELAAHDARLTGVGADTLESGTARKARIAEAQEAATHATALEGDAAHRAEEAKIASKVAREATERATAAEKDSVEAAALATRARARADELTRALRSE